VRRCVLCSATCGDKSEKEERERERAAEQPI
jgi:hypothetical protein